MPQLSQRLPWLILKEIAAFFLSFILYLNIFCKKLNHSMLHDLKSVILYIAIISHIQIHIHNQSLRFTKQHLQLTRTK